MALDQVKDLLLWCREKGIQVGRLRVGDIELELADLEQAKRLAEEMAVIEKNRPVWQPEEPPADPEDILQHLLRATGRADLDDRSDA